MLRFDNPVVGPRNPQAVQRIPDIGQKPLGISPHMGAGRHVRQLRVRGAITGPAVPCRRDAVQIEALPTHAKLRMHLSRARKGEGYLRVPGILCVVEPQVVRPSLLQLVRHNLDMLIIGPCQQQDHRMTVPFRSP